MRVVIAFDADKRLKGTAGNLLKPNVLRGEERLIAAFGAKHDVLTAEWELDGAKGIDDLLVAGGTYRLVDRYRPPESHSRVARPCVEPGRVDGGDDLRDVQHETRKRIERRFERGFAGTVAIIAPPPGTAKTGSGLRAQESTRTEVTWAVARHALAEELVERAGSELCACDRPRGGCADHAFVLRHDHGRSEENCSRFDVVQAARTAGYGTSVGSLICGTRKEPICPVFNQCTYQLQFSRSGSHVAPIELVAQRPTATESRNVVIVDDVDGGQLLHRIRVDRQTLKKARHSAGFHRVSEIVELLEETLDLAPENGLFHSDVYEAIDRAALRRGKRLEDVLAGTPTLSRLAPEPTIEGFANALPGQLVELIGMLHEEFGWLRRGWQITSGVRVSASGIDAARLMSPVAGDDGRTSLSGKAVAVLSSTPSPLIRQWTAQLGLEVVKPYQPKVALPASVHVIQDVAAFYGKAWAAQHNIDGLARRARAYLDKHRPERPALITHKEIHEELAVALGIPLHRVLYFGGLRGSNAVRDADLLLIVGTPGMDENEAYWSACAAYRGEGEQPSRKIELRWQQYGGWRDRRGRGREIEVRIFVDQRVAEVYESSRRDELIQAIYRCRPHDRTDDGAELTVVLMTSMPVEGLPVDLRFSGNAARAEASLAELDAGLDQLTMEEIGATARNLAEAAGTSKDKAAEYLRTVSAVCPPTCSSSIKQVGGQAAETSAGSPSEIACTCPPCPANSGDHCDCGRYWRTPSGRWCCGRHEPPDDIEQAAVQHKAELCSMALFEESVARDG